MKNTRRFAFITLAFCTFISSLTAQDTSALVQGNNQFAFDLYKQLSKQEGNLFFSPYSISSCLSMVYAGAQGQTAQEMKQVMHYDVSPVRLPANFLFLQQTIEQKVDKAPQLDIANGLWVQEGHPFLPAYLNLIKTNYAAQIKQANFATQAEPTREEINKWVSDKTHEKIQDLLPPRILQPLTRMVLVNAVYFKGIWASPFDKNTTQPADFHLAQGKVTSVPLMNSQKHFPYMENDQLQLLCLPYSGDTISMVILLPKDALNLKGLVSSLNPNALDTWISAARQREVNVYMPKFKSTSQFSLKDTLTTMGMQLPFGNADFYGMDGDHDLYISAVIHKAYVDVYEEGTEAAAATAVVMAMNCAAYHPPEEIPVFRADHPFIYLIRDNKTGSILFLGRMTDPSL